MMRNPLTVLTNRCNVFIGWVRFAVIDFFLVFIAYAAADTIHTALSSMLLLNDCHFSLMIYIAIFLKQTTFSRPSTLAKIYVHYSALVTFA